MGSFGEVTRLSNSLSKIINTLGVIVSLKSLNEKIIVAKFGGSSMADHESMLKCASIVKEHDPKIVLVSAMYGTTDKLCGLIQSAESGNWNDCERILFGLREKHFETCNKATQNQLVTEQLRILFGQLETLIRGVSLLKECSPKARDQIISFGERCSSLIFNEVVNAVCNDRTAELLDIRKVLRTDSSFGKATANINQIHHLAQVELVPSAETSLFITQGFMGADESGSTTTLGRGGSDYSAALIAEGVDADILQIWTDVAGIATTDPKICMDAKPISEISYNEASEMAQYGAKILHPTTLVPAMRKNIPVFVGSSKAKDLPGTWIKTDATENPIIRAITKRADQALLTVTTPKMLNAYGFMGEIFEIFNKYKISVDCVTTSEISIAITTDLHTLDNANFIHDLKDIGTVKFETDFELISIIGNSISETSGVASKIFSAVEDINVRMMCHGASAYNFNLLVKKEYSDNAIKNLHDCFIGNTNENCATR